MLIALFLIRIISLRGLLLIRVLVGIILLSVLRWNLGFEDWKGWEYWRQLSMLTFGFMSTFHFDSVFVGIRDSNNLSRWLVRVAEVSGGCSILSDTGMW